MTRFYLAGLTALFLQFSINDAWSADTAAGKAKYDVFCATCHGPTGVGDGPAAAALNPKPKNLAETARTDAELKSIIKNGGTSVGLSALMPAWSASLSDPEIDNIIAYVRTLKK